MFLVFFGLGTASGGLLAGYLFDRTHRYAVPFSLDLALAGVGLVLLLVSGRQTNAPLRSRLGRSVAPAL
jgi:predicted MFS family arabinose efflux permease